MRKVVSKLIMASLFLATLASMQGLAFAQSQPATRFFPETNQSVSGRFLEYWTQNGGLLQQGYPISPLLEEQSALDGKTYDVQYFERAVFEMHPANPRPYDVELSLLGVLAYRQKYPNGAPNQIPNNDPGSILFPATGKRVGGSFLAYFNAHGGIAQQGLPISDEFQEKSDLDGKTRTVQYFERAVFEWNPSNQPPYNVLLSLLGTFAYKAKQTPAPAPTPIPPLPANIVIPPAVDGKGQYVPISSDRYLVWSEGVLRSSGGGIPNTFDIRAIDLRTNTPITVTDAPGDQGIAAIDGNLVVWGSDATNCTDCPASGIYAKDLSTGQPYTVTTGFVPSFVGVAGRKVAWTEGGATGQRIKLKDLDTNDVTLVREIAANDPYITGLQMSGDYLAWNEVSYNDPNVQNRVSHLKAYDLKTAQTFDAFSYVLGVTNSSLPNYSLSGGQLVLQDSQSNTYVKDLANNATFELPYKGFMNNVTLKDNIILFSSSPNDADINGINLDRASVVVPVITPDPSAFNQYEFTLARGKLVYVDASQAPSRLVPPTLQVLDLPDALK